MKVCKPLPLNFPLITWANNLDIKHNTGWNLCLVDVPSLELQQWQKETVQYYNGKDIIKSRRAYVGV